jgi:DNA-binding transcriptional MocR family regulator
MLAWEMLKTGFLDDHIQTIRTVYGERRNVMIAALKKYFPEGCSWTHPQGGLFLWARVPEWLDTEELLKEAVEAKVAFVPGFAFYADVQRGRNTMRLNFSNAQPAQIEEGIRRLGVLLQAKVVDHERIVRRPDIVPA